MIKVESLSKIEGELSIKTIEMEKQLDETKRNLEAKTLELEKEQKTK